MTMKTQLKIVQKSVQNSMSTGRKGDEGWEALEHCPLCASTHLRPHYLTRDRHYGIPGNYRLAKCHECSLVFLNPLPTEAALSRLYPETYYAYQSFFGKTHFLKRLVKTLLFFRIGTKDPKFAEPGRVLDLGCGSGKFLYAYREKGWRTFGVEINSEAARLGREAAGLDIFAGNLMAAAFPRENFDYIRSNHSFEHIVNPNETLEEIRRVLKPHGKLLIGVPNIAGWNSKFFRRYWWYLRVPVHPFSYSVTTLSKMLQKHGFLVEKVTYNSDFTGILGSLQIVLNRHTQKVSSEGWLFNFFPMVVLSQWAAMLLDRLHQGDAIEIVCRKDLSETQVT